MKLKNLNRKMNLTQYIKSLVIIGAIAIPFQSAYSDNIWAPYCAQMRPISNNGCQDRLSIEEIRIEQGTDLVFNKKPDGCSGPHNINTTSNSAEYGKVVNTENNPVELSAGGTYKIGISSSGNVLASTGYAAGWIDYNQNFVFNESEEFLNTSATSWTVNSAKGAPGAISYLTFTIPCSVKEGITRIRISLDYTSAAVNYQKGCMLAANIPSNYPWYGETEDIYVRITKSATLAADFNVPTSIYINSPVTFYNNNTFGFISHEWDKNADGVDYVGKDYVTEFSSPGTFDLKLSSTNCFGTYDVTKSIQVKSPTTAPVINFVANKTVLGQGDELILYDVSSEGPYSWDWQLNDKLRPTIDKTNIDGTPSGYLGKYNRVLFQMNDIGTFDVCLTAANSIGTKSTCKTAFVRVGTPSDIYLGIGENVSQLESAIIYDRGGASNNYSTGSLGSPTLNNLLIQPCGATEITLDVKQLRLANNLHSLKVWDGINSTGKPLHPQGGFTRLNSSNQFVLHATSGAMYLELNTFAGVETDSGFIASYESVIGKMTKPTPAFDFLIDGQTQAFTNAVTTFVSNSRDIQGLPSYGWFVDGLPVAPSYLSDQDRMLSYTFPSQGKYEVCLYIRSCAGDTSVCKQITVVNPNTTAKLEIGADNIRPELDEVISLTSYSNSADRFQWFITPLDYEIVPPYTLKDKDIKIKFKSPGAYNINLRGWNSGDSVRTFKAIVKDSFVRVVDYCEVIASYLLQDVGNNSVTIKNKDDNQIFFHSSTSGVTAYQDFTSEEYDVITIQPGGTYNIELGRKTNFNNVSRSVYFDWNGDGIFDNSERVLNSYDKNATLSGNFTVPNIDNVVIGTIRMRVVVSNALSIVNPCDDLTSGEIEDYRVRVFPSTFAPVITMNGDNLIYTEIGANYTDAGSSATDQVEGDISNRIKITTNLNTNETGIYFYRYNVKNSSNVNALQKERTIIVVDDNIPPVITLNGSNPDYYEAGTGEYIDPGFSASDNIQGDMTKYVNIESNVDVENLGTYSVKYVVADMSGNIAEKIRTVVVGDKTAPVINFVGEDKINIGSIWTDLTFATDNFWSGSDLVLNKKYGVNGVVNPSIKGSYEVTYEAVDGSGNKSTATKVYLVDDFNAPIILLNTDDTIYHDVNTPYSSINPTIYDLESAPDDILIFKNSNVNPYELGTYTELFRATDETGNQTEAIRTVKVVDREAPSIIAPYICTPQYMVYNNKHNVFVEDNYYSADELLPLVEVPFSDVNIFIEGFYKNLYVVTDPSGNRSEEIWRVVEVNKNCDIISSVSDVNSQLIKVSPNPSNGIFDIDLGHLSSQIESIVVLNSIGETIMNISLDNLNSVKLDLSEYSTGVYYLNVSGQNFNKVQKLILVK